MGLVKVAIIGVHPKSMEMLHRRIGGIVKGIATLQTFHVNDLTHCDADLLIAYAFGSRLRYLQSVIKSEDKKIYGVELTLLPAAVRTLCLLGPKTRIGVIAEHQSCANHFMCEIVKAGVMENKFTTGTFEEMPDMDVDCFVVSEEMEDLVYQADEKAKRKKTIIVPRTVSAKSAAEIINTVLEIAKNKN